MKIKGVIEDFKILKSLKKRMIIKIVKIYLGLSLVLLWAVWGQFIFGQFLGLACISQDLQAPSYVVSTNYRVLIYCTCRFQGGSLCFSFFCLLVSSVSDFCPDTKGAVVDTFFFGSFVQLHCWGEGHCKQITLACACSVSATLGLPPLMVCVLFLSTLLRLQVALPGTEAGPGLYALPRSKPLRFRHSGSPQRRRVG